MVHEWVVTCTPQDKLSSSLEEEALLARAEELTYLTIVLVQTNAALEKRNEELDQFAYVAAMPLNTTTAPMDG